MADDDAAMSREVMVHVRFAADGSVSEIGARPPGVAPQEWFNALSSECADVFRALSGGRGLFRIESGRLSELQARTAVDHKNGQQGES